MLRCRATIVLVSLLSLVPVSVAIGEEQSERMRVRLSADDSVSALQYLEATGSDIAGRDRTNQTVDLIVREDRLGELSHLGTITIVGRSRPFRDIQAERIAARMGGADPRYKTYSEVLAWMDRVQSDHPEIALKVNLTRLLGTPVTWEGREMFAMKISDNVARDEDETAVLFDFLHHARELNTIEAGFDLVELLTDGYGAHPVPTAFVDDYEIWVVPVVNPDGLEYVWTDDNNWRKNRRDNGDGSFGVDLNRNYPFLWGVCGNNSGDPDSEVYRGPAPLSEPEVQTMVALGEKLRPAFNSSYHSYGREVLTPYACATLAEPVSDVIRDVYRRRMDYEWRLASSSGESFEWFYNQVSSVAYLTEMGTGFQPPYDETLAEVARLRPGWIFLLQMLGAGPLVQGVVTDSVTGAPLVAEVASDQVDFVEGERRGCEPDFGRYAWLLAPGAHLLTFSADGYEPKMFPVESLPSGTTADVALEPLPWSPTLGHAPLR